MIDRSLRRLLMVLLVGFAVLMAQVSRIQVLQAEELRNSPDNGRSILRDFNQDRGRIVTSDGVEVAVSNEVFDSVFTYQRSYPEAELYAHTVGYYSFNLGAFGVEKAYNDWLSGRASALRLSGINTMLGGAGEPGTVVVSLRHDLQAEAERLLGDRHGSVVMIEPATGAVLALYSSPSFDPNLLSTHDGVAAEKASRDLLAADGNPRRPAAYADNFFPGSSFKLVTAAAALDSDDLATIPIDMAPAAEYFAPLATRPIRNSADGTCGGTIDEMIAVSCNTGFAQLAAEMIGPDAMVDAAGRFGFNEEIPFDIAGVVPSVFPTDFGERLRDGEGENRVGVYADSPVLAQSALGQNNVSASPLQMAMVAATISNGGRMVEPHVVAEIRRDDGSVVHTVETDEFERPVTPETAIELREAMKGAVESGTARSLALPDVEIGAKTGTAQVSADSAGAHAWVVGYAAKPGFAPDVAFAVHVEATEELPNQSGSRTAVPIAKSLLEVFYDLV